nr:response regulator [Lachnospiraceae bacterium]
NEELALESICRTVKEAIPNSEMRYTSDAVEALEIARDFVPDVAFLDIEMPGMNGMTLAYKIKQFISAKTNIIFTTGYDVFIEEAFMSLRASGYLLKPITKEMILKEMEELRYPVELKGNKRIRARCFGSFELYIDDIPVTFKYTKTKELVAYAIDRGGLCSLREIESVLWEDDEDMTDHGSYIRNMISDLTTVMETHDCKEVIIRKYGQIGIDEKMIDCDYYEYKSGNPASVNAFRGEYMSQFSWAEETLGELVFK